LIVGALKVDSPILAVPTSPLVMNPTAPRPNPAMYPSGGCPKFGFLKTIILIILTNGKLSDHKNFTLKSKHKLNSLFFSPDTINVLQHLIPMEDYSKSSTQSNISIKMPRSWVFCLMKVRIFLLNQFLTIGVVLAAEKKEFSPLFVPMRESGKLYKMDEHIMVAVSGVVADANYLVDCGRLVS